MRRDEIIGATSEITKALSESGVEAQLTPSMLPTKQDNKWALAFLTALRNYTIMASNFSPTAVKIKKIIDLEYLEDPVIWARLIGEQAEVSRSIFAEIRNNVRFALKHLPQINTLINHTPLHLINNSTQETDAKYSGKDIISIFVIEEENRFSSPQRLIETLESVSALYRSCAQLLGLPPEGLSVIACDSGSDKSFDFLGNAKVIECLKEFILSMWDRIVFFRERQLEERIELVNKSLPVYDRIAELVKEKKLEPEMGEILRRNIFEGTSKFIKAGVTIPEIEKVSLQPPRALMSPEPKLLVSAPDSMSAEEQDILNATDASPERAEDNQSNNVHKINFEGLSDREQALLTDLLKKVQQGEKADSSENTDSEIDIEEEQ